MSTITNVSTVPQPVANGRMLAPGESAENVQASDHDRTQAAAGALVITDEISSSQPTHEGGGRTPPRGQTPSAADSPPAAPPAADQNTKETR